MEIFVQILVAVLFVGAGVALIFWDKILYWADKTLYPWIKHNLPELESYVRDAFWALDKVVTPIRNLRKLTEIKEAWKMLREYLLKVLVQFEQKTRDQWVKRITHWAIRNLESKQVARVVTEENINVDSLPSDVRQEWLQRGNTTQDVDVTQLRDRELELAMTNSN
ncbi:hypothetical protein RIVM261_041520 [Rivularia sp. IAM M-261]|nr:hypothetical protein RIVM261_041520 [Rivularia sp. IAM M-261]